MDGGSAMPSLTPMPQMVAKPLPTRREFVQWSGKALGLLALSRLAPSPLGAFVSQSSIEADRRVLVLVQLVGGNDGFNTVIPLADETYRRLRPTLAVPEKAIRALDDTFGFHPACRGLHELATAGKLTVVHNVGYPLPSRSHFRSAEIWAAGGRTQTTGWLGRYLALTAADDRDEAPRLGAYLTPDLPACLRGHGDSSRSISLEAGGEGFAAGLQRIAAHLATSEAARVYVISLGGFDTHSHQAGPHAHLLQTLSSGLLAFQETLAQRRLERRVLTMTVSEFGRRPAENSAHGTDHGTAAPLFLLGANLPHRTFGRMPELPSAPDADLVHTIDFRSVYAAILEDWLGGDAASVLEPGVEKAPVFTAATAEAGEASQLPPLRPDGVHLPMP